MEASTTRPPAHWANRLKALRAWGVAVILAFAIGEVSRGLAMTAMSVAHVPVMREPIAVLLALGGLALWNRVAPADRHARPFWGHMGWGLLAGIGLGLALPGLALAIMQLAGAAQISLPKPFVWTMLGLPALFLVLHGFAEEIMMRAIAQRAGHYWLGPLAGVVLAAFAFSALQWLQGYVDPTTLLNSWLFGLILGLVALSRAGIWGTIAAHAAWSWLELVVLGQPGQIVKAASFWAGAGPDSYGSPVFTCVLLVALCLGATLMKPVLKPLPLGTELR
jgi:membrane protease YdiL (CAAX protease family)